MFKGKPKAKYGPAPGPTATALLDLRKKRDGFVMHDVTVPTSFAAPYVVASAISSGQINPPNFPSGPQWNGLLQVRLPKCTLVEVSFSSPEHPMSAEGTNIIL